MSSSDWLVPIAVAIIANLVGLIGVYRSGKNDKADLAKKFQKMANSLALDLEAERNYRRVWEDYVDGLLVGIRKLIDKLRENNIPIPWQPGERPTRPVRQQEADE